SQTVVADIMPIGTFMRSSATATPAGLIAKLNQGPFLVNYFGHGSVEVWDDLLSSTDAAALTNASASIYVSMNCLNGFFHDLYTTSLAEALLEAPSGGAVAAWASSTLVSFDQQLTLNREFLRRLSRMSIGEADIEAKKLITDVDAQRTWMIFGDPTLFGAPTESADGGAVDGGTTDGAAGDANDGDVAKTDAAASDGQVNADSADANAPADGALGDAADAGRDKSAAGCSCDVADGAPARGAWLTLGLLLAFGALARRRARLSRARAR
ncbi:MAG TPA: C25 family cysteine peptidase, partial [Polyangia bacterium]|nr:C25 family cysteine peptidase [Polyangia bacterium]